MSTNLKSNLLENNWSTTDDVVMGGVSQSTFSMQPEGNGVFSGTVSLEHNGGFSSVKSPVDAGTFSTCSGITFNVRGDGKKYKLYIKTEGLPRGVNFQYPFQTIPGEWTAFKCEFAEMVPVLKGKRVEPAYSLSPEKINVVGLLISNGQEGPFHLEIKEIKPF